MVKASGNQDPLLVRVIVMKANGKVIKNMEKVSLFGKVEMYIVANIGKMKGVAKGLCIGQMVASMKVIGLKEYNMVMEKSHLLMGPLKKEFSRIICSGVLITLKMIIPILKMITSSLLLLKMKQHSMQVKLVAAFTLVISSQLVFNL